MSDILKKDYNIKNDNKKYSYNDRKKLSTRVKEIKSKEDYVRLFKIINRDPNNKFTENSNGIWLDFKILEDETIEKVSKFLNKLSNKKKKNVDSVSSIEYVPYSADDIFNIKNNGPKLSNYEKSILRRHKYSDDIELLSSDK